MLTRTITIQAQPPLQITLYFKSRSNAEKPPTVQDGVIQFADDFNQHVTISNMAVILSDLTTDVKEMFEAQGEMEVKKLVGAKHLEDRINGDPLLKMWVEQKKRSQQNQQPRMPTVMMPMKPPVDG